MTEKKQYTLTGADGQPYLSDENGTLGRNKRDKIYGRLDCPFANYWVKRGTYQKIRVFFKDEETAIAAGYRPCGHCMREKYKRWKATVEAGEVWRG